MVFAWGLTFARVCELGRVVPDYVVKELRSLSAEYPANGSFFVPLVAPKLVRAKADAHAMRMHKRIMVKPHG